MTQRKTFVILPAVAAHDFMIGLIKNRSWLLAGILLCSAKVAYAQAPSGQFEFAFDNTVSPLINMSGSFTSVQPLIGVGGTETPVLISVDITNAMNGALKGSGFSLLTIGGDPSDTNSNNVAVGYTASGRVSGGGLHPIRVILSVKMTGEGPVVGINTKVDVTLRYNLFFNAGAGTLDGTCRGTIKFAALGGSSPIRSDSVSIPIPSSSDGSWLADMNILALNRLGGSGSITTSDGRNLPGILSGTFSPRSGRSVVRLSGMNETKGMSVTFTLFSDGEGGVTLDAARGKALGQTIRF